MTMTFRGSIRRNLLLLAAGALGLYYLLVFAFSALFMEPYYLRKVEKELVSAYDTIRAMESYDMDTLSSLEASNLNIVVVDRSSNVILYNSQMTSRFVPDFRDRVIPSILENTTDSDTGYSISTDELMEHTSSGASYSNGKRVTLGGVTEKYVVEISTSYASISQAITISLQFSLIVGLMVLVLAVLAFSRMSAMVVGPITQITSIAGQIAHLDFSQTCDTTMGGEIGQMAESVNTMSQFMQSYIDQLQAANAQLKADILQKKEQEEARKNLVANLSHDLKTPIGLISGYADGLRQGMAKTDEEVREYCDVICDESDRMMTLILKMMELFRLESGTVELEPEEFDLADLLNYQAEIFSMELERAGIHFTTDFGEQMYVTTDYFSAEQVLTNYMQNAISHMSGGKEMRLSARQTPTGYRVEVFNSAAPIPEEEMSRIWDSFYRLDKSRSRRATGLGLSIVQSNMELLGGTYGVENTDGGVTFWAEFPKDGPEPKRSLENAWDFENL
jgi:signal transduction histidine kinase